MCKESCEYLFKKIKIHLLEMRKRDLIYYGEVQPWLKPLIKEYNFLKRTYKKNPKGFQSLNLEHNLWVLYSKEFSW